MKQVKRFAYATAQRIPTGRGGNSSARAGGLLAALRTGLVALALLTTSSAVAETPAPAHEPLTLLMVEEHGCMWCARWDAEIADIYPKTQEGQRAPLRRVDINAAPPEGVELKRQLFYTPTFVLLRDGKEIDRIEGYPGEDFFWGLLGRMMERSTVSHGTSSGAPFADVEGDDR